VPAGRRVEQIPRPLSFWFTRGANLALPYVILPDPVPSTFWFARSADIFAMPTPIVIDFDFPGRPSGSGPGSRIDEPHLTFEIAGAAGAAGAAGPAGAPAADCSPPEPEGRAPRSR